MTEHLQELEEISRLKLGIIVLIKELDKPENRELRIIKEYLKDLVEGVNMENTKEERKKALERLFKDNSEE